MLLRKKNNDQLSYFFNNIEQIFKLERPEHHAIFGLDYDKDDKKKKDRQYQYESQPYFGHWTRLKKAIKGRVDLSLKRSKTKLCKPADQELEIEQNRLQDELFPIILVSVMINSKALLSHKFRLTFSVKFL